VKYDIEGMKETLSKAGSGGGFWKAPAGKTKVRVLPGTVGNCDKGAFYRTIRSHRIDLGEGTRFFKAPPNGRFDAFETCAELFASCGMTDQAKECRARTQFAVNLNPHQTNDIVIWRCSKKQIDRMISYMTDEDWGDFTDPEEGFCLTIERTGEDFGTRYEVTPSRTEGELCPGWEQQANDLSMCDGEEMDSKKAIALLSGKFEADYDDLTVELLQMRSEFIKLNKKTKKTTKKKGAKRGKRRANESG
jgi:hypothetical protein